MRAPPEEGEEETTTTEAVDGGTERQEGEEEREIRSLSPSLPYGLESPVVDDAAAR